MVVVPMPCLRVDRLADAAEDTKSREVVVLDVVGAEAAEETDGGGCGVELGEFVLLDGLPVAGRSRVDGSRLEDGGGDTVGERAVDDVAIKSDTEENKYKRGRYIESKSTYV